MQIAATIIPIFLVIAIGWIARRKGIIETAYLEPANRLVYYLAIPAMVFRAIARTHIQNQFNAAVLMLTLLSVLVVYVIVMVLARFMNVPRGVRATFVQGGYHGNLGYVGFAVAYYYLGDTGLSRASIISGFMMILQNFLSISALQFYGGDESRSEGSVKMAGKILGNPVILSALAGIGYSLTGWPIPSVADRSLGILGDMALPTALLIIGASLSFDRLQRIMMPVVTAGSFKLVFLPGLAAGMFLWAGLPACQYLPALILLASPSATVVYVLSKELGGDPDMAVAVISFSTLMSAFSFVAWLGLLGTTC